MPSHYCRQKSQREFLEPGLSVAKMFELYSEECEKKRIVAQKKHTYSKMFNQEFNIGFYVPKTDRSMRDM